jgi:peptide/nickel transport system permease protein
MSNSTQTSLKEKEPVDQDLELIDYQFEAGWKMTWRRFRRHKVAMIGGSIILVFIFLAIFAPLISPYDPARSNLTLIRTAPSFDAPLEPTLARGCNTTQALLWKCGVHPFGTDDLGRDILTRVMYGGRVSLLVGFVAAIAGSIIGTLFGAIAALWGGAADSIISRFVEIMLSIPQLPLLLIIVGILSNPSLALTIRLKDMFGDSLSIVIIISVIVALSWMGITRLVRGEILSLREREYVDAAHALGFSKLRIIVRHLIPNVSHVIIVQTTLQVGEAILVESGLSFLGLGIQPPAVSWGSMLALAQSYLFYPNGVFIAFFPGIFIILTVLAFNFLGDGMRDALDPRSVQ